MTTSVMYRGITIEPSRDANLSEEGKDILKDRYCYKGENFQELFARVATYFADDHAHAQRLYDYISKLWFIPATPVLSNGGTNRGLPISCFLSEVQDSLEGIWDAYRENMRLAALGGGLGLFWNLRSVGEPVGDAGETSGVMPFMKVFDSQVLAVSQGSLRRGSAACYLHIDHPEVEEFLLMRKPSGGDLNRKCLNLHNGLVITDAFMNAVAADEMWRFKSPKTGEFIKNKNGDYRQIRARDLFARIIEIRMETGEPYLLFIDTVNEARCEHHKLAGLTIKTSNLCVEIMEPTNHERTAVCCLSSLNLAKYLEWRGNTQFVEDVLRMLDNVLSDFIKRAEKYPEMKKAKFAAENERSVGMGVMGWHAFLQSMNVEFESDEARMWNRSIFKWIREQADAVSKKLADEKGPCPDAARFGKNERFSYKMALAPTASISSIGGSTSPSIEPWAGNAFTHKTLSGSFLVKNSVLEAVLDQKGKNTPEVWASIIGNDGSVQHLDFLSDHEKRVFRTAYELDQSWIVRHAAERARFIDQGASNNLFFTADADKSYIMAVHWQAWAEGVKSLYYCRSQTLKKAHAVGQKVERKRIEDAHTDGIDAPIQVNEPAKYAVCEACQ